MFKSTELRKGIPGAALGVIDVAASDLYGLV